MVGGAAGVRRTGLAGFLALPPRVWHAPKYFHAKPPGPSAARPAHGTHLSPRLPRLFPNNRGQCEMRTVAMPRREWMRVLRTRGPDAGPRHFGLPQGGLAPAGPASRSSQAPPTTLGRAPARNDEISVSRTTPNGFDRPRAATAKHSSWPIRLAIIWRVRHVAEVCS